jgi:hypothetical protein
MVMAETILIPTDFCVASLNTLKHALEKSSESKFKIILIYSEYLNTSISDLLFYSPNKSIDSRLSFEFKEGLQILKNRFEEKVIDLKIKLFHGYSTQFLNVFLEANEIDKIFIPKNYKLKIDKKSFDPIPLLKKTNVPIIEIDWNLINTRTEQEQLIALFNNK